MVAYWLLRVLLVFAFATPLTIGALRGDSQQSGKSVTPAVTVLTSSSAH